MSFQINPVSFGLEFGAFGKEDRKRREGSDTVMMGKIREFFILL